MVAMRDASGFKYFLSDQLGSVSVVLDDEGTILEQQRYLPFGQARVMPPYASVTSTDFTYTGQRNLPDTGLMDYNARFYSPVLGRFIQPDSMVPGAASPQTWNRFSYVTNNPLRYTDPTGHRSIEEWGGKKGCTDPKYCKDGKPKDKDKDNKSRKPGEPFCKAAFCEGLENTLSALSFIADGGSLLISLGEAGVATYAYGAATVTCVGSAGAGCDPAFAAAFGFDMLASTAGSPVEDTLGFVSTGLTAFNDVLLGNTGYDPAIGPYVGKDTVVSLRNTGLGLIKESFVDLGVSGSQFKYDIDRATGKKSGGYIPVADVSAASAGWAPIHKDLWKQIFVQDWW